MSKDLLAKEALSIVGKLLTLQDRNPHSPNYGCFDRNYWHYKIIDFPSGMAQEFVWPLALAFSLDLPANPYYRQPAVKEWAEAGISFAARTAHRDGSCDDYYPYERALGATAFSLLACAESYPLLGMQDSPILEFFERRADWLAHHDETGRLANHQALVILSLELVSSLLGTRRWQAPIEERLQKLLSWQSAEGWFSEYGGFDPGYHTLTISALARVYELKPSMKVRQALSKAVKLAAEFVHPDGSYGGEYGSRSTYSYFPHGFELVGAWMPEALQINDRCLAGLAEGRGASAADDHIIGHHAWNYLLAWRDFVSERPAFSPRPEGRVWLSEARVLIDRRKGSELYVALNKGGVFKLFRDNQLVASDTQISLQVRHGGKTRNAVAHLVDSYQITTDELEISVEGSFGWAKHRMMDSRSMVLLRLAVHSVGRLLPNLIRRVLQAMLIVGKRRAPFSFRRTFRWEGSEWSVADEIFVDSWANVVSAGVGPSQTSIYVAMSRTFQSGQMRPWLDLTDTIRKLAPGEHLRVNRYFRAPP